MDKIESVGHCIVGAGLTGIYNTLLLNQRIENKELPDEKIFLIESTGILGGHLYTGTFKNIKNLDGSAAIYEAGGARFCKLHQVLIKLMAYAYDLTTTLTPSQSVDSLVEELTRKNIITAIGGEHQYLLSYQSKSTRNPYYAEENSCIELLKQLWEKVKSEPKKYRKELLYLTLEREYGTADAKLVRDTFGYDAEFMIQNTYDALRLFDSEEYYLNQYYVITHGFNELLEKLKNKLEQKRIYVFYNAKIKYFSRMNIVLASQLEEAYKKQKTEIPKQKKQIAEQYQQTADIKEKQKLEKLYQSLSEQEKEVAMKQTLEPFIYNYYINLSYKNKLESKSNLVIKNLYWCLNPTYFNKVFNKFYDSACNKMLGNIFDKIAPISLHRIYIAVKKPITDKMIITDNSLRMIIPYGNNGSEWYSYMLYSDSIYSDILKDLYDVNDKDNLSEFNQIIADLVNKLLGTSLSSSDFIETISEHWKEGVHFVRPHNHLYDDEIAYQYLISGKIDDFPNMFICGEAYSKRQAWVEGGLEMINDLHKKN